MLSTPPWSYQDMGARPPLPGGRDVSGQGVLPNLGLHHLATTLELHGHAVTVLDGYGLSEDALLQRIQALRPDAVGLSVVSPLWPAARALSRRLPQPVVVGGPHPAIAGAALLDQGPRAVITDHAESALLDWVNDGLRPGLFGPDSKPVPHPRGWATRLVSRVPWSRGVPNLLFLRDGLQATSATSTGCARRCATCDVAVGHSARPADEILEEMLALDRIVGVRTLSFVDDTPLFARTTPEVQDLLEALTRARLKLRWTLYLDRWDLDTDWYRRLYRAGCRRVLFLVESGSPRVRAYAKGRKISQDHIIRSVRAAHAAGIEACARFQIGYLGETPEDARQSLDLALQLPLTLASFIRAMAYTGSRMARDHQARGLAVEPLDRWSYYGRPVRPDAMSPEEQDAIIAHSVSSFYRRPRAALAAAGRGSARSRLHRAARVARRVALDRTE